MKRVSDNDFDKLFQEKLAGVEINPSEKVWNNISSEISPRGVKKGVSAMWLVAASVLVVLYLGFLFKPQRESIKLQASTVAEDNKPVVERDPVKEEIKAERHSKGIMFLDRLASLKFERNRRMKSFESSKTAIAKNISSISDSQQEQDQMLISKEALSLETKILPDTPAFIAMQGNIDAIKPERDLIPASEENTQSDLGSRRDNENKGIQSVGDLVNFVVRKVDHRKEKIIEFSNHDEGSSVSGINLGLIKIKTKQNTDK